MPPAPRRPHGHRPRICHLHQRGPSVNTGKEKWIMGLHALLIMYRGPFVQSYNKSFPHSFYKFKNNNLTTKTLPRSDMMWTFDLSSMLPTVLCRGLPRRAEIKYSTKQGGDRIEGKEDHFSCLFCPEKLIYRRQQAHYNQDRAAWRTLTLNRLHRHGWLFEE